MRPDAETAQTSCTTCHSPVTLLLNPGSDHQLGSRTHPRPQTSTVQYHPGPVGRDDGSTSPARNCRASVEEVSKRSCSELIKNALHATGKRESGLQGLGRRLSCTPSSISPTWKRNVFPSFALRRLSDPARVLHRGGSAKLFWEQAASMGRPVYRPAVCPWATMCKQRRREAASTRRTQRAWRPTAHFQTGIGHGIGHRLTQVRGSGQLTMATLTT